MSEPFLDLRVGHVLDQLAAMPDASVHCCVTSPPYYGLRSYDVPDSFWGGDPEHDHEWSLTVAVPAQTGGTGKSTLGSESGGNAISEEGKLRSQVRQQVAEPSVSAFCACGAWRGQLGLEPTPEQFIEHLVDVFREVRRVLRQDGSLWVNIGDSYASNPAKGGSGTPTGRNGRGEGYDRTARAKPGRSGLKEKDLIGVPWMLAFALRADGWWLRSENIWRKLGGMPESVFDRTSREHEHIFHLTESARYFYDTDAIREPYAKDGRSQTKIRGTSQSHANYANREEKERWPHPDGKIKRSVWQLDVSDPLADFLSKLLASETLDEAAKSSVWEMATANYPGAHFAVFPLELPTTCILATTSEQGACSGCGAPWRRIVEADGESVVERQARQKQTTRDLQIAPRSDGGALQQGVRVGGDGERRTVGWEPTCSCVDPVQPTLEGERGPLPRVPCTVLDPFVGSGTSMVAARREGRSSIGIEVSEVYAENETAQRISEWWKDASRIRDEIPDEQERLFA